MARGAGVLDRLVLVAGLTGVRLRAVHRWLQGVVERGRLEGLRKPECVVLYEDVLLEGRRLDGCVGIDQMASILQIAREAGRRLFVEAAEDLARRLWEAWCGRAVVFVHLSYMTDGVVVANPAIAELLGSARHVDVIYLVDDYYDALDRIERRLRDQLVSRDGACRVGPARSPFTIDPLEYLSWRAVDYNLLTALESFKPGLRAFIFGVKHPPVTFLRLLDSLLKGDPSYEYVYASHPISGVRGLYAAGHASSIASIPVALAIEAFKAALIRANDKLVLFEPTTVDEHLADPAAEAVKWLPCPPPPGEGRPRPCAQILDAATEGLEGAVVEHSLRASQRNRWPLPSRTLYEEASGEEYPYRRGGEVSLLRMEFVDLYGGTRQFDRFLLSIAIEAYDDLVRRVSKGGGPRALRARVGSKLLDHVSRQIEMRDYHYVSQARVIAVILPLLFEEDRRSGKAVAYYLRSQGAEAEMHRAIALGKPLVVYMLPVDLGLVRAGGRDAAAEYLKSNAAQPCAEKTLGEAGLGWAGILELAASCAERVNALFTPSRHATHYCVVPVILGPNGDYKPTGDYDRDLDALTALYTQALRGERCTPPRARGGYTPKERGARPGAPGHA